MLLLLLLAAGLLGLVGRFCGRKSGREICRPGYGLGGGCSVGCEVSVLNVTCQYRFHVVREGTYWTIHGHRADVRSCEAHLGLFRFAKRAQPDETRRNM